MAHKYREEVVGKRFLSVSASCKLKLSKISEWCWKAGVIRAATHKDNTNKDLQVLVEYDGLEWQKREWLTPLREDIYKVFMVEAALVWAEREDPHGSGIVLWPGLTFTALVSRVEITSRGLQPLEFLHDQHLTFTSTADLQPYKEWDPGLRGVRDYPEVREAARRWCEAQDGQRILLTTPSILVGYRIQVYRAEGTTQFYTAVIVGYNEATRELTVTDDTVLEEHNEDPCLLQMRLIGDGVVESIMRGEEVGITPRRSRSSVAAAPNHFPTPARGTRGAASSGNQQGEVRKLRRSLPAATPSPAAAPAAPVTSPTNKVKADGKAKRAKRKGNGSEVQESATSKEDLENKCTKKKRPGGKRGGKAAAAGAGAGGGNKKKVLEEANCSSKLRVVEVRVEDCLRQRPPSNSPNATSPVQVAKEDVAVVKPEDVCRMDDAASTAALLRFPDDRSDSGVSSLRSGSGDERSGSRSSALSSSDEPQTTREREKPEVWRDPGLLLEPSVRHIQSVQHQSLLMSHPPGSAPPPPSGPNYPPPPPMLSPHPLHHLPPPNMYQEMLWKPRYPPGIPVSSHLHPAAQEELLERERQYAQDRDRHDRLIRDRREQEVRELELQKERDRERDRDKEREREREKAAEREKQLQQERLDRERERLEKQRAAEKAVHKHFEESLRLAHQKRNNMCWNLINSLPPPHRGAGGSEEDRKRAEAELQHREAQQQHQQAQQQHQAQQQQQQQRLLAVARERASYYPASAQVQRPPSVPNKVDYPPPPAHSRVPGVKSSGEKVQTHTALPKAEPNFNLFGYPAYQPPLNFLPQHHDAGKVKQEQKSPSLIVTKTSNVVSGLERERELGLPNPPPLMSDIKNSVIVKNEGKNAQSVESAKSLVSHSQSPKLRVNEPHYLPPASSASSQMKSSPYEYRSPSQSPHHPMSHPHTPSPHHPYEGQNLASISKVHTVPGMHHRARQSPHPPAHRQSPHPPPPQTHHRQSPHQHPHRQSPHHHPHPSPPGSVVYTKSATVGSYPYPSPAPPPLQHYVPPVTTPPKPKVSSPAPPHIYGKPTSGITSGTPVCRPQDVTLSPLPLPSKPPLATSPYQQLSQHHPPPPHQVSSGLPPPPAHSSRTSSVGMYDHPRLYPHPSAPGVAVSVKPPPSSPPTRSSPLHFNPGPHIAMTPAVQTQPLDLGVSSMIKEEPVVEERPPSPKRKGSEEPEALDIKKRRSEVTNEPVLSRVSEPSPLLASAATTITTVVNTAVAENIEPLSVGAPGTPVPCSSPAKPGSGVDSEKSNSPGPRPVHKLKKAWLQRHSGEDGTEDKDVVGSGSCLTLPLTLTKKEESVNVVSSLHSIGSMAVNSINKTKPKGNNRKGAKDNSGLLNGHITPVKLTDADDSSSSDPDRKSTPLKRVPPKVKRKKGGVRKPAIEDSKRKKLSASSTDSDKESGSEKDSDGGQGVCKKAAGGREGEKGTKDNGRKRGRRPKTSASNNSTLPKNEGGEEPRGKKPREDPPAPFQKPPVAQLKKTGESFLQDGPCFEVAPKLAKCRECRWTPNQRSRNMPNIFCRFYAFRRLRYTKNGQLAIAGFSDPHRDPSQDDLKLWLPSPDNPPGDLDMEMSRFLLLQVGDQFCDLLEQEKEAISVHMSEDKVIAWKRVVQGVREMCDVCETTLFNFHWACGKCGFVVCIDCYKGRKNGTIKMWGEPGRDRDDLSWLLCTNRQPHEQEKLMLTQIIAGDSLVNLGRRVHESRAQWGIPMNCGCPLACALGAQAKPINGICKDLLKNLQKKPEPVNGQIKIEKDDKESSDTEKKTDDNKNSPLNWLADVALSSEEKKQDQESGSSSDSDQEGNYSTLRELLIRPSHKSNGSRTPSPANNSNGSTTSVSTTSANVNANAAANNTNANTTANANANAIKKKSKLETLDEVISSVIEHTVSKDVKVQSEEEEEQQEEEEEEEINDDPEKAPVQLKHFVRRYTWGQKGREPLAIRVMTLTESKMLYPDVPHSWLSDGKLLRLMDSNNSGNYPIFQDQWKRGQPIIVSDVTKHLDMVLWHPDSFVKDFGDAKNDLVNCMTGNLVPNQPMRKFWEGFEHFSKRLKDDRGNPMLLKLKDWPPGEDFAEMLPSRFNDLMKVLPLGEYSQRGGRLNLASRLPDCFVRPDLGPKMYTAYGSALHPTKGTTNLHLDISDAVNVMVYVSIPKDGDNDEHVKEALRAIDEAGCDILTRRRVREKGELPGALWHIYQARDADKIRDLLNKVALERGARLEPHHDPIHDQSWYLDGQLQERLYKEYGVEGYAIVQCLGDAVFIPAGAPHQVRNLHNCIKVAEDFVSPENVSHCFHLTQEFRELSDTHSNHEDKLQIKNIMYHAVKDSLSVLSALKKENSSEAESEPLKQEETDS